MTGQGLAQQVRQNAPSRQEAAASPEQQISGAIRQRLTRIEALMPGQHVDPKRMAAQLMVEVERNPKLAECTPESIVGAILQVAQAGLELGPQFGQAWLIPRRNKRKGGILECNYQTGYKGVLDLARRHPSLESVIARPVFEGEHFRYSWEPPVLEHAPGKGRGEVTHAYCRWTYKGGGSEFIVLDRDQIEERRQRGDDGPSWRTDYAAMAAKSAVMAARSYLPLTVEAVRAMAFEGQSVTMTERDGVLTADGEYPELGPGSGDRQVDAATGEVTPKEPVHAAEPRHTPDDTRPQTKVDVAKVLEDAGVEPPLHLAVALKASNGLRADIQALTERDVHGIANHAKACAAGPEGFVRAILARKPDGEVAAPLVAWLAELEASRDKAAEPEDEGRPFSDG